MGVVGGMVNQAKPRYAVLDRDVLPRLPRPVAGGDPAVVEVFVDAWSALGFLWRPDVAEALPGLERQEAVACAGELVNLVAHWRHWLWTRACCYSTVYLTWSSAPWELAPPGYRESWYLKRMGDDQAFQSSRRWFARTTELARHMLEIVPYAYAVDMGACAHEAAPLLLGDPSAAARLVCSSDPWGPLHCVVGGAATMHLSCSSPRAATSYGGAAAAMGMTGEEPGDSDALVPWAAALMGCPKHGLPKARPSLGPRRAMAEARGLRQAAGWEPGWRLLGPEEAAAGAAALGWDPSEHAAAASNHLAVNPMAKAASATVQDVAAMRAQLAESGSVAELRRISDKYYASSPLELEWLLQGVS